MYFLPLYFCFARRTKFCKNFSIYQVSDAETLPSECKAWPNPFQNLNSNCKKIPLSSPPPPPTFGPLLAFKPPKVCPFIPLPPLNPHPHPPMRVCSNAYIKKNYDVAENFFDSKLSMHFCSALEKASPKN